MIRTYSELIRLKTFEERYEYLRLSGQVGESTFGSYRYLNQKFYNSELWRGARRDVIVRDGACDLAIPGRDIYDKIYVHHMNPAMIEDFEGDYYDLLNPEFLISTSFDTHQAITFGDRNFLKRLPVERRKGDTTLWTRVY